MKRFSEMFGELRGYGVDREYGARKKGWTDDPDAAEKYAENRDVTGWPIFPGDRVDLVGGTGKHGGKVLSVVGEDVVVEWPGGQKQAVPASGLRVVAMRRT